ncbi:MAG TPA: DNA-processing protein DprA [Chitinophagaceae bacterium]|jgi:DNA processing protein|nr:DNA-processing protein DprA [Chitinophagaceae bacterium]
MSTIISTELLYQIALTLIPQIGPVQSKILVEKFGNAEAIFKARYTELMHTEGIGAARAGNIKRFNGFREAEDEMRFIEQHHVQPLFITDKKYPQRLIHCYDSPTLLYYKGNADLNTSKIVSIVGTRNNTEYGRQRTEQLIEELASQQVLVVSGLAFGIDAIAHKKALKHGLPTIGVLAHGLDQMYPIQHTALAKEMQMQGGLLTEFMHGSKPDKHNFPTRNRIVAGMSDATIVVETGDKGGSMITAELANNYNKDVFAFPGRSTDVKSAGCNQLIRANKAALICNAHDLAEALGWNNETRLPATPQRSIFIELTKEQQVLFDLLKDKGPLHIDEINTGSGLSNSSIAMAILDLELQHVIVSLPGKMYQLRQ